MTKRILAVAAVGAVGFFLGATDWAQAVAASGQDVAKSLYDCGSGACTKRSSSDADDATSSVADVDASPACQYGTNRCERYSACSLYGDLSGANGETLEMYRREKTEDGRVYDDFSFPEFRAMTLGGEQASSATLTGRPALVAFVAAHCRHSMRAMPHLQQIADAYGSEGLRVVTVWVNSGSIEDVRETTKVFDPTYETWVHPSPAVGDAVESHLVPSFFFVDAEGRVEEKWVGEKTGDAISARARALLEAAHRGQ